MCRFIVYIHRYISFLTEAALTKAVSTKAGSSRKRKVTRLYTGTFFVSVYDITRLDQVVPNSLKLEVKECVLCKIFKMNTCVTNDNGQRMCSTCRKHFSVLYSFMTHHRVCN